MYIFAILSKYNVDSNIIIKMFCFVKIFSHLKKNLKKKKQPEVKTSQEHLWQSMLF